MLKIFELTTAKFELMGTVLFSDQDDISSWSDATVELDDAATQFQIVAEKTGVSTDMHYVLVDDIELSYCPSTGNYLLSV